jgi:dihydroorotate dehydrogenase
MNPYAIARPLLFALDAERAHELVLRELDRSQRCGLLSALAGRAVDDPVGLMGLRLRNRVGLAAGLDKNAAHLQALVALGFGFLEVGTVTPRPQPGNPRPRIFRVPQRHALINRLGFNNEGLDTFVRNLAARPLPVPVGANIGKNASTPIEQALDDYRSCLEAIFPIADYVTVNISSPNTRQLRQLQGGDDLMRILAGVTEARERLRAEYRRAVPLVLKIAPDLDDDQIDVIAKALLQHGFDGVIATNTTVARDGVAGLPHAEEAGGLSGAPVFEVSNQVIVRLRAQLPAGFPIIGVGGILSGADARAKIDAGADVVQIYTGLIYRGPALVRECARALAAPASAR